jgi:hypothetical protein
MVKLGDYGLAVLDPTSSSSSNSTMLQLRHPRSNSFSSSSDGVRLNHTGSSSSDVSISSCGSSSTLGSPCYSSSAVLQAGGTPAYTAPEVIKAAMHNTDLMTAISTKVGLGCRICVGFRFQGHQ